MKNKITIFILSIFVLFTATFLLAEEISTPIKSGTDGLMEELRWLQAEMNIMIETASGIEESLVDAPATIIVITAQDIKQRGYTDLAEVMMDLPGFDVMLHNGTYYLNAYQRGYRTASTTRTLFMINGIVDNHLWLQQAAISRQYPLSNIKKIEILYGPASAVYGPNAFLGIINVITYDGGELDTGKITASVNALTGSYDSKGIDTALRGKFNEDISFAISGRIYQSDEPDFTGKFGFLEQKLFEDSKIFGPLLELEHHGRRFGSYYDPTDDYGILGTLQYKNLKLGLINWVKKEAYGPYYPADRAQNNSFWNFYSKQFYAEYEKDITDDIKTDTLLLYRESRVLGLWPEAEPDWNAGMGDYSYISYTHWSSISNSWLFKQNFEVSLKDNFLFVGGLKYERKELTKAYDAPGYWLGAVSSSTDASDPGPYGSGSGIGHSTDTTYTPPPGTLDEMPGYNVTQTDDIGGYIQGILDLDQFRYCVGVRYDKNSVYGSAINPRISTIYKFSQNLTFKLLYGESFQEPPGNLLWGGWSGRNANPDLKPEKAQNFEFIMLHQMEHLLQEISLYYGRYKDVIKEAAENAGNRNITGFEYRAKTSFPNFVTNSADITGYFYYTFTKSKSSVTYNPTLGVWQEVESDLGDIAPHKFNIGLNVPVKKNFNVNLRGNFISERELYSRNPLRGQDEKLSSYFVLNGAVTYICDLFDISFKVLNILDKEYFHPGPESASSGNDFTQRSKGYHNSIIPQPGRSYWLNVRIKC
ncbi:TonB-dependent receptor plug domain-containing protein [Candidatus Auribacterota bacterium]